MEHRFKRDTALVKLISHFESSYEQGQVDFLREETINQLLSYYERGGQLDKAMEVVNIALDQYKYRSDFYIAKARLLLQLKQIKACLDVLDVVQNIAPYETDIPILRARALSMSGQFAEALSILADIKEQALIGDLVDIHICESHVYETMKQYDDMYSSLIDAITIDPLNPFVLRRLWVSVDLSRRYEESITLHNKLLDANPYSMVQPWSCIRLRAGVREGHRRYGVQFYHCSRV
jgi:tetratricopeptide (TPR) repeat protein